MSRSKRRVKDTSCPPSPPLWKGRDALELVHQLNERSLRLLKESATQQRELWSVLDVEAIHRAARFPFLILEVHFSNESWWQSALKEPQRPPERVGESLWPLERAEQLTSEVLVFAWHTAKWDCRAARLVLGMVPGVVRIIQGLTPQELVTVSRLYSGVLRLRWQENTEFWARLLRAARVGDAAALADIHLHAQLLLSGDLLAHSAPTRRQS